LNCFCFCFRPPYPNLTTPQYIAKASILKLVETLPSTTPEWILSLISSTQERDPTNRPTFVDIFNRIGDSAGEIVDKEETTVNNNNNTNELLNGKIRNQTNDNLSYENLPKNENQRSSIWKPATITKQQEEETTTMNQPVKSEYENVKK